MRKLVVDIETSPNLAYVWDLWQETTSIDKLVDTTEVICFSAKWVGERGILFYSVHKDGKEAMLRAAHDLLDEADVVIHYNGASFDVPHLNREFLQAKLPPPSPFAQVDLFSAVKRRFRFPSNKLAYVTEALGLPGKMRHAGFELWVKCLAGDDKAWAQMERYNKRDVAITEQLYHRLLPWIPGHPSYAAVVGEQVCPTCGSDQLERRGLRYTGTGAYQRFVCKTCRAWSQAVKREHGSPIKAAAL